MAVFRYGIIGLGNLGQSVCHRLLDSDYLVSGSRKNRKHVDGIEVVYENTRVAIDSDIISLCVKQKDLYDVASEIKDFVKDKLVVSFVAGVTLGDLKKFFEEAKLSRVMTSLAFKKCQALTAVCYNDRISEEDKILIENYLKLGGEIMGLEENRFNAFTSAYACAIGWVDKWLSDSHKNPVITMTIMDGMTSATESLGFTQEDAIKLTENVIKGYEIMTKELEHGAFFAKVASKGGMTAAGYEAYEQTLKKGLAKKEAILKCYERAAERGEELTQMVKFR